MSILVRGAPAMGVALAMVLAGCASVATQWKTAQALDTREAYEAFVRDHPGSSQAASARGRLLELRWDGMRGSTDLAALEALEKEAGGVAAPAAKRVAAEARDRRATIVWSTLRESRDPAAVDAFAAEFPAASVHGEVEARREALAFEDVRRRPGPATWRGYLGRFPSGNHAAEVREAGEGACWQEARASGDEGRLRQHLALFPDGAHATEAREAVAEVAWRRAEAARTDLTLYREVLKLAPSGPRAEGVQDCVDWAQAEDDGTQDAVEQYLRRHPRGRFAERARQALPRLAAGVSPGVAALLQTAPDAVSATLAGALSDMRATKPVPITGVASIEPDAVGISWQGAGVFGVSRSSGGAPTMRPFSLTCSYAATFGPGGVTGLRLTDEQQARLTTGGETYVRLKSGWAPALEPFFTKR